MLASLWAMVALDFWHDYRSADFDWVPPLHIGAALMIAWATALSALMFRRQRRRAGFTNRTSRSSVADAVAFPDAGAACPESVSIMAQAEPAAAQMRRAHAERMQTLGQLAAGISHDFNNILTAVHGSAALIDQHSGDAMAVHRFTGVILDAACRGRSITRRLLCFARREEVLPQRVDPGPVLEAVSEIAEHTLGRQVSVRLECPAGLPPLMADRAQLETALLNLAINARDAMAAGGILTLTAAMETVFDNAPHRLGLPPGGYIRLSVTDTGVGMDPTVLSRVLEPFFTTKPEGHGTGLGLSMAKTFAEQSGGGLAIDSTLGTGTMVSLWLPVADGIEPDTAEASPGLKRILLVEDDRMVSETLTAVLQDCGFAVTAVASGAEALAVLRSAVRVDALLTELSVPDTDGVKLIDQAQSVIRGLPAVLLTACPDHETQLAMRGAISGRFSLLRKPVSLTHLVGRIEALIADAPR
jgi:signal transduction histidine kinase/CheY-like chemotaxis protein